jgi:hypothetical protein
MNYIKRNTEKDIKENIQNIKAIKQLYKSNILSMRKGNAR